MAPRGVVQSQRDKNGQEDHCGDVDDEQVHHIEERGPEYRVLAKECGVVLQTDVMPDLHGMPLIEAEDKGIDDRVQPKDDK